MEIDRSVKRKDNS